MLLARDIGKRYDGRWVLQGVSLEVQTGEVLGILGPNGSGKSTLLSCLVGEKNPDAGEIWLKQRPLAHYSVRERAQTVAVLAQEEIGDMAFSVKEVVEMGRHPYQGRWPWLGGRDREVVDRVLAATDSAPLADRLFAELSGGEKQRVSLARAMAQEPELLALDEPTTYLDVRYQYAMLNWLKQWQREQALTLVMVLHDLNLAAQYCDRLLVLKQGRLVCQGTPHEVITTELIETVYGIEAILLEHPVLHVPQVLMTAQNKAK